MGTPGRARRHAAAAGAWLCVAFAALWATASPAAVTSDSPVQTGLSEQGHYRVTVRPEGDAVPVGELHNWLIRVETVDGELFIPRQLVLLAGMPEHGHGLASSPRVTQYLESGDFLVEGVRFQMTGLWDIVVHVTGPRGPDTANFTMELLNAAVEVEHQLEDWSQQELRVLSSLHLDSLPAAVADFTNRLSQNADAADLGRKLFFDEALSETQRVSCATCHDPALKFTDGRRFSFGSATTARHSPTIIGVSRSNWFYWDGRRDSLWSQSVTPLETRGEMDRARTDLVRHVVTHEDYGEAFLNLSSVLTAEDMADADRFPPGAGPYAEEAGRSAWAQMSPVDRNKANQAFADVGKVISAYVETLQYSPSRFDNFVAALLDDDEDAANELLTESERNGAKLFIDSTRTPCLRCHNGPLFTNFEFHNVGTGPSEDGPPDFGRYVGLQAATFDEFNCRGDYSDATRADCEKLKYSTEGHADEGAFKVPSLRNVAETPPYLHDGRFADLSAVLDFYLNPPDLERVVHEIPDFELSDQEAADLVQFLRTLSEIEPDYGPIPARPTTGEAADGR